MASLHKQPGKPYWFVAYTDQNGNRHFKSTKCADRKQARAIATEWERAVREARRGLLTPEKARDIIARGVAEVFASASTETLPESKLGAWLDRWLETKSVEASASTLRRYTDIIEGFRKHVAKHLDRDIASLSATTIAAWRDAEAKRLSRSSVNLALKIVRSSFNDAMKLGLLTTNPASQVSILKNTGASTRREFTIAEIKKLIKKAGEKSEWEGMILFGLYTGQRLGDLAMLTWRNIDIERNEIALSTKKTGRRIVLPLVKPLRDYLANLPSSDNPDAYLFPEKARSYSAGSTLSGQFHDLLVESGLAKARAHLKDETKQGRSAKREKSQISFHSLRHSAVTFLKAAGVSDALAREIIGHESAAVSRGYTHLSSDDVANALNKLPDITKTTEAKK